MSEQTMGSAHSPDQSSPREEEDRAGLVIPNIPEDWRKILSMIQFEFPRAVLYGGALRDLILRREANDLDIAIPFESPDPTVPKDVRRQQIVEGVNSLRRTFNCDVKDLVGGDSQKLEEYLENMDGVVLDVFELFNLPPAFGNTPMIQIIVLSGRFTPWVVAHRCDFGICRVAYDNRKLFLAAAFTEDAQNREFKLRKPYNVSASLTRYSRLEAKYRGWTFVNGDERLNAPV